MPEEKALTRILIVDDDRNLSRTLADVLKQKGYSPSLAATGREALQVLAAELYAAAIIDLKLPDMTGLELIAKAKSLSPHSECIILTGYSSQSSAIEAVGLGAFGYLLKPYDMEQMLLVLQRAVERQQTEASLRLRESLIEAASLGIMILDTARPDRPVVYANCGMTRLCGYSREELIGFDLSSLTKLSAHAEDMGRIEKAIESGREIAAELPLRRKDGSSVWSQVNVSAIRPEGGLAEHVVIFCMDISERKSLQEQLMQAHKMEAVGKLAGGIAHDFNNMMMVVLGYSDVLLSRLGPDDPLKAFALKIRQAGERAASLTDQLLTFSRKKVIQPLALNLNRSIEDLKEMLQRLLPESIEVAFHPDRDLGNVRADPSQIERVLLNLALNSRDAMPQGGTLTLSTANSQYDERWAQADPDAHPSPYVALTVSDTGVGMDRETLSHLFEPFFTTKKEAKGTGLGLATVYGIVKQNGGVIRVESEPGQGTTVSIFLPRVEEEAAKPTSAAPYLTQLSGGETVLLVEDEELLRELARETLEAAGYRVLPAANGEEALKVCDEHEGKVDLMLTDVVMPKMSAGDLAAGLRERFPDLAVLYMSGYPAGTISGHAGAEATLNFLSKPFGPEELLRKIRELLDVT